MVQEAKNMTTPQTEEGERRPKLKVRWIADHKQSLPHLEPTMEHKAKLHKRPR